MIVTILADNHPGPLLEAEHGLSYLIEFDRKKLLFDTGQSNLFLRNANAMGIDLNNLDRIILSHGHFDHGDGLLFLSGNNLLCHPGCFVKRYRKADHTYIGLYNSKEELAERFDLITSAIPYRISEKIIFLGEIPRVTNFESKYTSFLLEGDKPDFVADDSAIAMILDEGLFIITGCGHAGIVNTIEHAKTVTGLNEVVGIMGGFHLKTINRQTDQTVIYLKKNRIRHVYAAHCTENPFLSELKDHFYTKQVKTGDIIRL